MNGPYYCWHCGKKLQLPHYAIVRDRLGHEHRVHKCCAKNAADNLRQLTANIPDVVPNNQETP